MTSSDSDSSFIGSSNSSTSSSGTRNSSTPTPLDNKPPPPPSHSHHHQLLNPGPIKVLETSEIHSVILECDSVLESVQKTLEESQKVAEKHHIDTSAWNRSAVACAVSGKGKQQAVPLTGGYYNTNHIISLTGDEMTDRLDQIKRKYINRLRSMQLETKGGSRWDKPKKVPGERRRRIVRDADAPEAPPEPPISGYTVYLAQMTTKIRHDRPNEPHDQSRVMQEISWAWKTILTDEERESYNLFADIAKREYKKQLKEFRATGSFTPSNYCEKKPDANLWVRKRISDKNSLEKELETYETYVFPLRPPEMDEAYKEREAKGKEKRKRKLQQERQQRQKRLAGQSDTTTNYNRKTSSKKQKPSPEMLETSATAASAQATEVANRSDDDVSEESMEPLITEEV